MKMRKYRYILSFVVLLLATTLIVSACGGSTDPNGGTTAMQPENETDETGSDDNGSQATDSDTPEDSRYGGSLIVANALTPAHLDTDITTDSTIGQLMFHVYEGLFEIDKNFMPVPHLASDYTLSEDGTIYSIKLREGVLFHDGTEMTSADVVASFERWLTVNGAGNNIQPYFVSIEAKGDYEVTITLSEPYAPFLSFLSSVVANQKFTVKPKALIDQFGTDIMTEHIGTGPFMLDSFIPDQYVRMKRFEDYAIHDGEAFGYSGKKIAYVDELTFQIVPEQAMRVAGLQTGEFHFADFAPRDQMSQFENDADIQTYIVSPYRQSFVIVNMGHAPFDNKEARQAMLYGIDMEELGLAMVGDEQFWFLNPSLFPPGHIWHVPDGDGGRYNQPDLDKARGLLEDSGYDGTPIIILNSREDDIESRGALALQAQLQEIGFNVDVQLYDRATVVEQRARADGWHLHFSQFFSPDPDPQVYEAWMGTNKWIGNWDDAESAQMDAIFARMLSETDYEKRYEIVEEWHDYFYETVPYLKLFDFKQLRLARTSLKGYENFAFHTFFNVWLED